MYVGSLFKINNYMRAKFVNEIKQNRETSGLGAIGIGKVGAFKG